MPFTSPRHRDPIVQTDELTIEDRLLAGAIRLRITNVPTIVRTGGHEPGVRRYYTLQTMTQLQSLQELARLRLRPGETQVELDFTEDATLGHRALHARRRQARERYRKRYHTRVRGLSPVGTSGDEGHSVAG